MRGNCKLIYLFTKVNRWDTFLFLVSFLSFYLKSSRNYLDLGIWDYLALQMREHGIEIDKTWTDHTLQLFKIASIEQLIFSFLVSLLLPDKHSFSRKYPSPQKPSTSFILKKN